MNLKDKQVLVMGLGRFGGGADVVRFMAKQGGRVTVTDRASQDALTDSLNQLSDLSGITYHLGNHTWTDFESADLIVVNPAVPPETPFLLRARDLGIAMTTQINLFLALCPATVVGITGANGKSTTTALCAHLLKYARDTRSVPFGQVWLGGNIGHHPLLTHVADMRPEDVVILELSSFQTEWLDQTGVHVALLTNLTPNHLDRHKTFDAYCDAKERLFQTQALSASRHGQSLFCADDPVGQQWHAKYQGQEHRSCSMYSADHVPDRLKRACRLPGRANLTNLAGALAIAGHLGVPEESLVEAIQVFKPLAHRLELVEERRGVRWFNDSIATTPESVMVALEAFEGGRILIAGGYDKGIPFDVLARAIVSQVKAVILMGQTGQSLRHAIKVCDPGFEPIVVVKTLEEAVVTANSLADSGDAVLLSPACASYDMFDNFQDRGDQFKQCVFDLSSGSA
ncbi:MAG: UDP-N-acetylmuramoyl-L-alanine--D-glutamate ligase [Planctomycetes bacterium]|nr:UDP-N-acetylmuramoyl-L-alanine--D-glutamate ligase [Planctomycetota bacterium]